ncbi:MAG: hypothetical protein IT427_04540 [Pirellulales bacterium]|nr:hypothetical protein [Pirellulales bacterium]
MYTTVQKLQKTAKRSAISNKPFASEPSPRTTPLFSIDPRHAWNVKNNRKFPIHFTVASQYFATPPGNEPEIDNSQICTALGKNRTSPTPIFPPQKIFPKPHEDAKRKFPDLNP